MLRIELIIDTMRLRSEIQYLRSHNRKHENEMAAIN